MSKGEQPRALRQSLKSHLRRAGPPGRGDFWILKIAHAPSPKNLSKNGLPRKGVAFLWKAFLQKNFQVREKIPLSALRRMGRIEPVQRSRVSAGRTLDQR